MSTPTKAAEIIREALEAASKELDCSDWGEVDVNGEGALKPYSHDIVAMPQGCPACKVRHALSLLADLDGGGEAVSKHLPTLPSEEDVKRWFQLLVSIGPDAMHNDIGLWASNDPAWRNYHPSPTAADAPPDPDAHITDQDQYLKAKQERAKDVDFEESRTPVDVAGVIKAGDAMANRLKFLETSAGLQAVWKELTKPFRP